MSVSSALMEVNLSSVTAGEKKKNFQCNCLDFINNLIIYLCSVNVFIVMVLIYIGYVEGALRPIILPVLIEMRHSFELKVDGIVVSFFVPLYKIFYAILLFIFYFFLLFFCYY